MALTNTTATKRNQSSRKCVWFVNILNAPPHPHSPVRGFAHAQKAWSPAASVTGADLINAPLSSELNGLLGGGAYMGNAVARTRPFKSRPCPWPRPLCLFASKRQDRSSLLYYLSGLPRLRTPRGVEPADLRGGVG